MAPAEEQVESPEPALAVGGEFTIIAIVLNAVMGLLQYDETKFVTVRFVVPRFNVGVANVPTPGLPAVNIMVAVLAVAIVAPERLYVTA